MIYYTPRVERGSPELTGPGRVVCVAGRPSQEPAAVFIAFAAVRISCRALQGPR